jgi:hypothetical protein
MDILKVINKYKYLGIGLIYLIYIGVAYYNHESITDIIDSPTAILSIGVLILFPIFLISRYLFRFNYSKPSKIISEINNNISKSSTPFVVRIINEEYIYSDELKEKIIESDIWDWTILGKHVDNTTSYVTEDLRKNIQKTYFKYAKKISTSSLMFFKNYPFGRKCFYITGNIIANPEFFKDKNFPEFPFESDGKYNFYLVFSAYFEFESYLFSNNKIRKCKSTHDQKLIQKKWEQITNKIINSRNNVHKICWKDKMPEKTDIDNFIDAIDSKIIEEETNITSNKNFMEILKGFHKNLNPIDFTLFFIGFYNDAIVNIPISYFLSRITFNNIPNFPIGEPILLSFYYVITNIVGIVLMFFSVRNVNIKIHWLFINKKSFSSVIVISLVLLFISYALEYWMFQ